MSQPVQVTGGADTAPFSRSCEDGRKFSAIRSKSSPTKSPSPLRNTAKVAAEEAGPSEPLTAAKDTSGHELFDPEALPKTTTNRARSSGHRRPQRNDSKPRYRQRRDKRSKAPPPSRKRRFRVENRGSQKSGMRHRYRVKKDRRKYSESRDTSRQRRSASRPVF